MRGRAQVTDAVTLLATLLNGSPIPRNSPDTPASNPHGVSFPLNTGVLAIAELQFALPDSAGSAKAKGESALPGTYKIGAWYDSYGFSDQQYDTIGLPLASPNSNGVPAMHHGDLSIYGVMDQTIWRSNDASKRKLNVFIRPMFTPFQDRNLVSFTYDAGLTLYGPLPKRDDDTFGVGVGVARASSGASGYDRQLQFYQPAVYTPVRSAETFVEATYQLQVTPWWQIQPDVQYITRGRDRRPERPDAEAQERTAGRPAHQRHVLTLAGSPSGRRALIAGARRGAELRRKNATTTNDMPAAAT